VVFDAQRFPSDPRDTRLESNDVAILLRSDNLQTIADAHKALFDDLDIFSVTSIRRGFAGGGFSGRQSLPKKMAMAAGIPGADLIPDTSELFLGFTSTQKAGLGPRLIANHETLGFVDLRGGYFHGGTHMHLSHISEDLEAWYLNFDFQQRVDTTFRPGLRAREDAQTVAQGPARVTDTKEVERDFRGRGRIGHSSSIQSTSRLERDTLGPDGTVYRKGTAIPQRADFNTLDNPFFWRPDGVDRAPSAGVHFIVFNPSSDDFHRNRLAMDGVLPNGTRLPLEPGLLAQLEEKGQVILDRVGEVAQRVNTLLGDPNQQRIATALENISDASKATRQLVTNVDTTVKNKLDPALDQITVTVRGAQRTVDQIGATASEFRTTAQRLNAPGGPLERVTEGTDALAQTMDTFSAGTLPRLNRVADETTRTVRTLNRAVNDLTQNPQELIYGQGAPQPGPGEPGFRSPEARR